MDAKTVMTCELVVKEEKVALLANAITACMIENEMTLEYLDEACKCVEDVYRKNAIVKKAG